MRRRLLKVLGALLAVGMVTSCLLFLPPMLGINWAGEMDTREASSDPAGTAKGLLLAWPAFARGVGAQFPANEAGIAAHINKGRAIDLGRARGLLSGVWIATDDQVIGTVALPDLPEYMWPHAFISRDGWIVVYYPNDTPLGKLIQWQEWSPGDAITTTTLRDALLSLVRDLGFPIARVDADMRYFHFQHPAAATLLIVLDWIQIAATGSDTFQYSIPDEVILYGGGWSHRAVDVGLSESLIGEVLLFAGGTGTHFGHLAAAHLTPGTIHTVTILDHSHGHTGEWMALALVFVYRTVAER